MTSGQQPLGDGSTTLEKLRSLLAIGTERDDLDFKAHLDLTDHRDKVEMVKDFAAMQSIATGGYIVVGATDQGTPTVDHGRLDATQFDVSNLHRIAAPYLPTIRLSAATHVVEEVTLAIIYVGPPSPATLAVIDKDGQYPDGKKSVTVFVPGDVFVRSGAQSVRWRPANVATALGSWEAAVREDERHRASAYVEQLTRAERARAIAQGPLGAVSWRLAADDFDSAVLEALRAQDDTTLKTLVLAFARDAGQLTLADTGGDLDLFLDRLLAAAAIGVAYNARELFDPLLEVLVEVYSAAMDAHGNTRQHDGNTAEQLMLRVAVGVEALGGLAVRQRQLWAVRPLAMPSSQLVRQMHEPSWIRHAVTSAAWAKMLVTTQAGSAGTPRPIGGPVVSLARQLVERVPALRPDATVAPFVLNSSPAPNDKVLDSLIQFDVLWSVIAVAYSGKPNDHYPSFSAFYSYRADPAFELLITDQASRDVVLGDDVTAAPLSEREHLRRVLGAVAEMARRVAQSEGSFGWWPESPNVRAFLGPR